MERLRRSPGPDVIIGTTWNFTRGLIPVARKSGIPVVTVAHGLEVTRSMNFIKRRWLGRTLGRSHRVVAVSRFTGEFILKHFPVAPENLIVLPNGVDPRRYYPGANVSALKKRLGISDEKIILTLARVIPRKGHAYVIAALPEILKKVPRVKYIIAGEGDEEYLRELHELTDRLGVRQNVLFAGYVQADEMVDYYNLCDVYVMPSRTLEKIGDTEGFGITFLEANACEKPVIGGRSGGVEDAVVDGETGYLVDPTSSAEIGNKIIELMINAERADNMGRRGRKRILDSFTWNSITKSLLEGLSIGN